MSLPNRAPEPAPPSAGIELEARIAQLEAAVTRRDQRVRRRAAAVVARVEGGVARHAGTAATVGAGVLAWWFFRRRTARPEAGRPAPEAGPAAAPGPDDGDLAREAGLSLAGLLPLLWPLLPARVRRWVPAAAVGSLSTVLAALIERLARPRRRSPPSGATPPATTPPATSPSGTTPS